jgi:hypothetical protein
LLLAAVVAGHLMVEVEVLVALERLQACLLLREQHTQLRLALAVQAVEVIYKLPEVTALIQYLVLLHLLVVAVAEHTITRL